MRNSSTATEYLHGLLGIARRNQVRVCFLPRFSGLDWDGQYLVDSEMGTGIAVRDDLDPMWRDWILAHELGHHFGKLNGRLLSLFYAHKVDAASRARWCNPKKLDPDEENGEEARPAEFLLDSTGIVRWRNLTNNMFVRARPEQMLEAIPTME